MPAALHAKLQRLSALLSSGEFESARVHLLEVLRHHPKSADANCLLSAVLFHQAKHEQSRYYIERALELAPGEPNYLVNLGKLEMVRGDAAAAIRCFEGSLGGDPSNPGALIELTAALDAQHRYQDMAEVARRGVDLHPLEPRLVAHLAVALVALGRADEAVAALEQARKVIHGEHTLLTTLCTASNYDPGMTPERSREMHADYGRLLTALLPPLPPPTQPHKSEAGRRIRVGFLSPDFVRHSVAFFIEPILEHLNRDGFEITCYHVGTGSDDVTARLKVLAGRWRDEPFTHEVLLASKVRADRIDVLIDLCGHMRNQRLPVMHQRPAPLQITYCGYPNTTGVKAIDWRLVDSLSDPAGAEAWHTERLARLDPCFLCYRPPRAEHDGELPEVAPPPCLSAGHTTFGSFNALPKLNTPLILAWSGVLRAVPGSRLLIKNAGLKDARVRIDIESRFAASGIEASRLELVYFTPSARDHLAMYGRVDVALDTFPYHGTTTTCEAMLMGVPVVTMSGTMHAGRVGVSLLNAVGLPELIARDVDDFVSIAATLAADHERLSRLRSGMRGRLLNSPLCDAPAFAARFGDLLRDLWRRRCGPPVGARSA
ncbi:MAG: tetratricopeptide repeat protein [Phycisphaerales bacterium]|nr:tetratricopeptide repeat protein [Phycisphaerales bacterium]